MMTHDQSPPRATLVLALPLWIGSWVLVIPVPRSLEFMPSQAVALWGFFYMDTPPYTKLGSPADAWIANSSLYIGFAMLLITSIFVMLSARERRRAAYRVALVDLVIMALVLLIAWP